METQFTFEFDSLPTGGCAMNNRTQIAGSMDYDYSFFDWHYSNQSFWYSFADARFLTIFLIDSLVIFACLLYVSWWQEQDFYARDNCRWRATKISLQDEVFKFISTSPFQDDFCGAYCEFARNLICAFLFLQIQWNCFNLPQLNWVHCFWAHINNTHQSNGNANQT